MEPFKPKRIIYKDPVVLINDGKFYYNNPFMVAAGLDKFSHVIYHHDEKEREIGFEFLKKEVEGSAKLTKVENRYSSRGTAFINKYGWIKAVEKLNANKSKQFVARKRGNLWIITLIPAFENILDNAGKLPKGAFGIYKYSKDGEPVYIGHGDLNERMDEDKRQRWAFDKIEYSIITDKEKAGEFETHWIDRHVEETGKKPVYNLIFGKKRKKKD